MIGWRAYLSAIRSLGYGLPNQWWRDWRAAEFCVIDIETTGLDPAKDEIVSVGIVPISGGRIQASQTTYLLSNPRGDVRPESIKIHTLRRSDLVAALPVHEQIATIMDAVRGKCVVAHSAWIEREFLERFVGSAGERVPMPIVDTAILAERELDFERGPNGRMISLEYAANLLRLPVHTPHHALGDAMTTAQVFIALASRLSARHQTSVAELVSRSRSRRVGAGIAAGPRGLQ